MSDGVGVPLIFAFVPGADSNATVLPQRKDSVPVARLFHQYMHPGDSVWVGCTLRIVGMLGVATYASFELSASKSSPFQLLGIHMAHSYLSFVGQARPT